MCCVIVWMMLCGLFGGIFTLYIRARERETVCYNAKWGGEGRGVVWGLRLLEAKRSGFEIVLRVLCGIEARNCGKTDGMGTKKEGQ